MDIIFMNSKNSETSDPQRFYLKLICDICDGLSNLSM